MIIKRIYYIFVLLFAFNCINLSAQNNNKDSRKKVKQALAVAKTNIKKKKDLDKTEASMRELLRDSDNIDNDRIWLTLFEAVNGQYEQLNEKLYLGQQSDTAKLFTHTLHMFNVLESMDSVDSRTVRSGTTEPVYRKKHAAYLNPYRANLFSGGGYYLQKQQYANAYNFFHAYLDCANQPLFSSFNYAVNDVRMKDAAYWALFCGYKMNKHEIVIKYADLALKDSSREVYILQYLAESYLAQNNTAMYGLVLEEGFEKYPDNAYFFPRLAVYYGKEGNDSKVLEISDKALTADKHNIAALVAKSSALLHLDRNDECITVSDLVINLDSSQAVAYANAGLAYYNKAVPLSRKKRPTNKEKQELNAIYDKSRVYLEKYRKLMPDAKNIWATPLYNIYLNLNMGDEFSEIEKIIN